MKKLFYIVFFLLFSSLVFGANLFVADTPAGDESGSSYANRADITTFNAGSGLFADLDGDTVYFCDGIIDDADPTLPDGASSEGNRIILTGDCSTQGGTDGILVGVTTGFTAISKGYWTLQDTIIRDGPTRLIHIDNSPWFVIQRNVFAYTTQSDPAFTLGEIWNSDYGVFRNNTGDDAVADDDQNDFFEFDNCDHLLVYDNDTDEVTHDMFYFGRDIGPCQWVVVKSNTMSNNWHHNLAAREDTTILLEDNIFKDVKSSTNPFSGEYSFAAGFRFYGQTDSATGPQIARRNKIYYNDAGISIRTYYGEAQRIWIYHNTIYNSHGIFGQAQASGHAMRVSLDHSGDDFNGNTIINNIWELVNPDASYDQIFFINPASGAYEPHNNVIGYNFFNDESTTGFRWGDESDCIGNLAYMDASCSDGWENNTFGTALMTDPANADFTLQSGSNAIDAGRHLVTVANTGSGQWMTLSDADPFYTTGPPWNTPGNVMQNDMIKVVGDGNPADFTDTIIEINYATNQVKLSSTQSWESGAKVYRCPAGVCFSGSAPDIGAYEYIDQSQQTEAFKGIKIQ